jgi:hypothetical protein
MLLSELQEIFADRRRAPGDLRSMLEQCARALGEAACGETCEIWIWRSAVVGDRHLERIALFGQGLVENPLAVLDTEWSYPREFHIEPEVEPETAGRQIVHLALGPYGFATIVRPTESGITDFDQLLAGAAAIGDNIVGFLPREELEFSNQWLLKRNAFDRRAATSLAAVTSLDQLGLLVGELSESLLPIEIMGIYFIDPVSTRLRLVHAVGLNEQERRNAERTAPGRHPGEVISRDKILQLVWGHSESGGSNVIDVYVRYLRQKLEADPQAPRWLTTVWGVGYKVAPARDSAPAA